MNIEDFRDYCLSFSGVTEKMPFTTVKDPYSRAVLCFYVGTKWFCYVNIEVFDRCCLRSSAERSIELRSQYEGIKPAWHMNKRFWNDIYFNLDVPDNVIRALVRDSYNIILSKLTRKERNSIVLTQQH